MFRSMGGGQKHRQRLSVGKSSLPIMKRARRTPGFLAKKSDRSHRKIKDKPRQLREDNIHLLRAFSGGTSCQSEQEKRRRIRDDEDGRLDRMNPCCRRSTGHVSSMMWINGWAECSQVSHVYAFCSYTRKMMIPAILLLFTHIVALFWLGCCYMIGRYHQSRISCKYGCFLGVSEEVLVRSTVVVMLVMELK